MAADKSNAEKRSPGTAASGTSAIQESFLSPGFRSAAAMAGWDEEAILVASLVVEDTPVRESRHGKRPGNRPFRTPPTSTNSKKKRRSRRQSPVSSIQPVVLCLDEDDNSDHAAKKDTAAAKNEPASDVAVGADREKMEPTFAKKGQGESFPCMDHLREELSCAICLEICFEPTTTPCGHSFCIKCLKCAAAKCGKKCPKCRQLISNGRSCTVNTVLWNTIQLLFPKDVGARKDAVTAISHSNETRHETTVEGSNRNSSVRTNSRNIIRIAARASQHLERDQTFRRTGLGQSEDAALAFRLQREEFMASFRGMNSEQQRNALHAARVNLRAIRSRALHIGSRNRA